MKIQVIQSKIYEVRNQKIMFDFDLAILYEIETRVLKQAIKRNQDRFPDDFMFQLRKKEWEEVITNCDNLPDGAKYSPVTPYAFTEHGVAMLSSILRSKKAIQMNISIVRVFVALKQFVSNYQLLAEQISQLKERIANHDIQLNQIYEALESLVNEKVEQNNWQGRERIGFRK